MRMRANTIELNKNWREHGVWNGLSKTWRRQGNFGGKSSTLKNNFKIHSPQIQTGKTTTIPLTKTFLIVRYAFMEHILIKMKKI